MSPLVATITVMTTVIVAFFAVYFGGVWRLALLPATMIHEFVHLLVGKAFGSRDASYTVKLDASGVTQQAMRPITGPITWLAQWLTALLGYFGPPLAAVGIISGVRAGWALPTALIIALVYAFIPWLSKTLVSMLIMIVPSVVILAGVFVFHSDPTVLSSVVAGFAIVIAVSGVAQSVDQIGRMIATRNQGECDAVTLANISILPSWLYAAVHFAASLAGVIFVLT